VRVVPAALLPLLFSPTVPGTWWGINYLHRV